MGADTFASRAPQSVASLQPDDRWKRIMPNTQGTTMRRAAAWLALATGAMLLAGCESLNPFSSDDEAEEPEREMLVAKGAENADEVEAEIDTDVEDTGEYPNLATVPDAPESGMSPNQRLIIEEGLLADRENAQYIAGPPPKLLPQPGGQMPASPAAPVASSELPPAQENVGTWGAVQDSSGAPESAGASGDSEPTATTNGPAQQAALPPGEQVMLVSIRFPEGSAQAPAQVDQVLEQVAMIQKQEDAFLRVVGHTGTGATDKDSLSAERAEVIASRLKKFGAEAGKVIVEGLGDSKPVTQGGDAEARRQNNRVEIFLIR